MKNSPVEAGEGVVLSGQISGAGTAPGQVLVDVVPSDPSAGHLARYNLVCSSAGEFKAEIPPNLGTVVLAAFLDQGGNGPSADDAAWASEAMTIGDTDITGIEIALQAGTDMSRFLADSAPPSAPPDSSGVAPAEAPVPGATQPGGPIQEPGPDAAPATAPAAGPGATP
jgi:hypothetical protein